MPKKKVRKKRDITLVLGANANTRRLLSKLNNGGMKKPGKPK